MLNFLYAQKTYFNLIFSIYTRKSTLDLRILCLSINFYNKRWVSSVRADIYCPTRRSHDNPSGLRQFLSFEVNEPSENILPQSDDPSISLT